MQDFDIILGNDWLIKHRVKIDCYTREVCFQDPDGQTTRFTVSSTHIPRILNPQKFSHHIAEEDILFAVAAVSPDKDEDLLSQIPIACEFPEVFPTDLPGLPPDREIEFVIDLEPGTQPISKAPYRMAPRELKELRDQLDELSEKGFIQPSTSPWGAPVLFVKKKDGSLRLCID